MNKIILIQIVLLFSIPIITICQQGECVIKIDQKSIDLSTIDLDKGELVKETTYSVGSDSNKIERYYTRIKVFKNSTLNNYVVVYDTAIYSYDGYHDSFIQYFTSNGTLLFEKSFEGFEVFQPCISSSGDLLIVDLSNIDASFLNLYNRTGELIKSYSYNIERFYPGPLHKHFFISKNGEYKGPNSYDLIDSYCNIQEVMFPTGSLRGIFFSPQEKYYIVLIDLDRYLYDINNELIWKQPQNNMGSINITYDDKKYLVYNYNNSSIEMHDLKSNDLIFLIDSVIYNEEKIPIKTFDILDSTFYTVGKNSDNYIFNYYSTQGEIIQVDSVRQNVLLNKYKIKYESGKYVVKPLTKSK